MKIAVYCNQTKAEGVALAHRLRLALAGAGMDCYDWQDALLPATDLVVVIGGDGTVLRVVPNAMQAEVPIWAINVGGKGFLAEGIGDLEDKVRRLAAGDYRLDRRDTLAVKHDGRLYPALNDVCILRLADRLQTIVVHLDYHGEVCSLRGDGAVLCTPSGSTGYALSAGGPVLTPEMHAVLFAPICAHSLHARPMVFGGDVPLRLWTDDVADVFVDGRLVAGVGDVEVTLSDRHVTFVRFEEESFFAKIADKLY